MPGTIVLIGSSLRLFMIRFLLRIIGFA